MARVSITLRALCAMLVAWGLRCSGAFFDPGRAICRDVVATVATVSQVLAGMRRVWPSNCRLRSSTGTRRDFLEVFHGSRLSGAN